MLAFIDESGCSGFKLTRGSTPYFVVCMVVFEDHDEAQRTDHAIDALREQLKHKPEFKFSKCSDDVRDKFFKTVRSFHFCVRTIVVDKARLYSIYLRKREPFYNYFVQVMMQHDGGLLVDANVKIDESGDRHFKGELASYLKRQLRGRVRKIRFVPSRSNNLIQLADMVCGAIHRRYKSNRAGHDRWLNLIRGRIDDIWTFPNAGH